jgi:hypothetical protein
MHNSNAGPLYSIALATATLSTANAWDVLSITADSSASRVELVELRLCLVSTQYTSAPALGLQLLRGSTSSSTGASITPRNIKGHPNPPSAAFTAAGPSSGLMSTASAVLVWAAGFDGHGRLVYRPRDREERPTLALGQRLNLRVGTPQIPAVVTGSLLLCESGKGLPS